MRNILKKAYMIKVKHHKDLKDITSKMFSLENDLEFWSPMLERSVRAERQNFLKEIEGLEDHLRQMRNEYHFSPEEIEEMKDILGEYSITAFEDIR